MALDLPKLDDLPILRRKPVVEEEQPSAFSRLNPVEQATVRKQIELEDQPRSAIGEITTGFKRGVFAETPRMAGKALQWFNLPSKGLRDYADMQEAQYLADQNPEAHGAIVRGIAQGASMLAPSMAALAAIPAFTAAGLGTAGAVTAASALGGAAFGASQAQETYDKAIAAGKTESEARALGLETGAYEAGGEFLGGKILGGAFTGIKRALAAGERISVDEALKAVRKPSFLPDFGRTMAKTYAGETATEMGQGFLEAAAEKREGVDTEDPWKAASSAIIPTLAMTTMLGPFAGFALRSQQRQNQKALAAIDNPEATVKETNAAAKQLATVMEPMVGKENYTLWRLDRMRGAQWFEEQTAQRGEDIKRHEQTAQGEEMLAGHMALQQSQADRQMLNQAAAEVSARESAKANKEMHVGGEYDGVLSFEEFKAAREKQGELGVSPKAPKLEAPVGTPAEVGKPGPKKGGKFLPAADIRNEYLEYVRNYPTDKVDTELSRNPPEGAMSFKEFETKHKVQDLPGEPSRAGYAAYLREYAAAANPPPQAPNAGQGELGLTGGTPGRGIDPTEPAFALQPGIAGDPRFERTAAIREMEQEQEGLTFPERVPEAQGELDLQPLMNRPAGERPSPLDERPFVAPAEPTEPAAPAGAVDQKIIEQAQLDVLRTRTQADRKAAQERLDILKGGGEAAARLLHSEGAPVRTQQAEAQKAAELAGMKPEGPRVGAPVTLARPVTNPVAQAEAERQAAITGNTPITQTGLQNAAKAAMAAAGMKYSGQVRKKIDEAIARTSGHKLWVNQLKALRKARDAMKQGTATHAAMETLLEHLTSGAPTFMPEAQKRKGKQNAAATQVPAKSLGEVFGQDPLNPDGQNEGVAEAEPVVQAGAAEKVTPPTPPTPPAPAAPVVTTPPTLTLVPKVTPAVAKAGEAAPAATAGAAATTSAPKVEKTTQQGEQLTASKVMKLQATPQVTVTAEGTPVAWGDFSWQFMPDGTISYETTRGTGAAKPYTLEERTKFKKKYQKLHLPGQEVQPAYQRHIDEDSMVDEEDLYGFELYHYDPNAEIGDSANMLWVSDFAAAKKRAEGFKHTLPGSPIDVKDKSKENAKAAMDWLQQYDPEAYAAGEARVRTLERVEILNANMEKEIDRIRAQEYKHHYDEHLAALKRRGINTDKSTMSQEEKLAFDQRMAAAVGQSVAMDPTTDNMLAALPAYQHSQVLADALQHLPLDGVLDMLELDGPTEWVRTMAGKLRELGLNTKIKMIPIVARDQHGKRVYGRYNHGMDVVHIYLGGENAHTVTHEITHAATVGRIAYAKEAEKVASQARTSTQKSAVASLQELRTLMANVRRLNPPSQYAFKNEEEFIAEVLSNDDLRSWLDTVVVDNRSLGRMFMDWIRKLLGMTVMQAETALEYATRYTMPYLGASRFSAHSALTFNHSATGAMAQADLTINGLVKKYDQFVANNRYVPEIGPRRRAAVLASSSTYHLAKMAERKPVLRPMLTGANMYRKADATKVMIRTSKQQELSGVLTPYEMLLMKLPGKAGEINRQMEVLAGEQSVLNIDLKKNFDQNVQAGAELDASVKDHVNKLHSDYMRLDPRLRKVLDESVKVFRKNYIQQSTQSLLAVVSTYTEEQHVMKPIMDTLDILDPTLSNGTNPRSDYYFDAYAANLDGRLRDAFEQLLDYAETTNPSIAEEIKQLETFYKLAVSNPYHHLGRSGDYFVEFRVKPGDMNWGAVKQALAKSGKVVGTPGEGRVFMRFENSAQRDEVHRTMQGLQQNLEPESLRGGTLADNSDLYALVKGLPQVTRRLIDGLTKAFPSNRPEVAEMRKFLISELLSMQSDTAPSKAMARRKGGGVTGYDADFRRNFSKRAIGMSTMLSNSYTLPMFDNAFQNMNDEANKLRNTDVQGSDRAQEYIHEYNKRFVNGLNPVDSPLIDTMRSAGYHWFLSFSPAFVLTNFMQPYHLGLPYLGARHGFVASAKEMGRSTSKAFALIKQAIAAGWNKGSEAGGALGGVRGILDLTLHLENSGLSQGEQNMIRELLASGQLDTTQSYELGRFAQGETHVRSTTMKFLSSLGHYSELVNRLTMALASYNLDQRKGTGQEQATHNAIESVIETQFDYSDANTPRAFGRHGFAGKVTPLLTSFKKYSFQMIESLWRMGYDSLRRVPPGATAAEAAQIKASAEIARKQFGYVMATTSILGGTLGLPFASVLTAAYDAIVGDDDDPSDIKTAYRNWLSEVFGQDVGMAIARGVPRSVLGFDTSKRAGLADLLPGSAFFTDRRDMKSRLESGALDLLGPAVSASQDAYIGMGKMIDGMPMDGLMQMAPIALRGPIKSVKLSEDEGYTTATGNKLPMEVTTWAQIVQAAGFTPSVKAEQSEKNFAMRQFEGMMKQRKTVLSNKYYRAVEQGDDTTDVLKDVLAFNSQNPQFRIDTAAGLTTRAKARAVAEASGTGIPTLPRYLPLLERYKY